MYVCTNMYVIGKQRPKYFVYMYVREIATIRKGGYRK